MLGRGRTPVLSASNAPRATIGSVGAGVIWSPCQFTTVIQAELPRVHCPTHGVKQLAVPWAEPGSQFTAWFERLAIDILRECSVTGAAGLLRITWDEAWGIKTRAVTRGLRRRTADSMTPLGVDEKAIAKRHRYLTIVADLNGHRVLYVAEVAKLIHRHLPNLLTYLQHGITNAGLEAVNATIQGVRKMARDFQ